MNKKSKIFVLIQIFIILLLIPRIVKGVYCDVINFETDKDIYYINENIIINASWELIYDPEYERSSIQIQIYDKYGILIWNTSRYGEIGIFQNNWTVEIQTLNISNNDNVNIIYIKFVNIVRDEGSGDEDYIIIDSITIEIYKREISCELDGFTTSLLYGENLTFTARFIDVLNNSAIINQTVFFKTLSNNLSIYENTFITNQSGHIGLNISSVNHLNIGLNTLVFNITDSKFYNKSEFIFDLHLEKLPIFTEIIKFDKNLEIFEDIEILIYYYYYYSSIIYPLADKIIEVQIFQDSKLHIRNNYKTNESGILFLNIPSDSFNLSEKKNNIIIQFIYNGTEILNNKILNLEIAMNQSMDNLNTIQFTLILTLLFLGFSISIFSFYLISKKRSKFKLLSDLSFKF
ncbi:MAG: hypothetical protein ACFE85_14500 [Candidatus Hodarchaeota archaeon]